MTFTHGDGASGDMEMSHVAELKRALAENAKLKTLLAERDLEIDVMKELVAKKMVAPYGPCRNPGTAWVPQHPAKGRMTVS